MKAIFTHIFISIAVLLFFNFSLKGQGQESIGKLDNYLRKNKYQEILNYFEKNGTQLIEENHLNSYYLGVAHFHTPDSRSNAILHLENYISNTSDEDLNALQNFDAYFLLAEIYHLSYQFSQAKEMYAKFKESVSNCAEMPTYIKDELFKEVKLREYWLSNAVSVFNNPRKVVIDNLGDSINTKFPEYAPAISENEKQFYFTSRRPDENEKPNKNMVYDEDIFYSELTKGSLFESDEAWEASRDEQPTILTEFEYHNTQKVNDRINTNLHDACIQLSKDESSLFFYRESDIWKVSLAGDSAALEPLLLNIDVNTEHHEPSIFFSYDEQTMILASDRPGGYGGLDLYSCYKLEDGTWSELRNMGPNVNTQHNEDSPYLDPNNRTFYFSSQGHSSMGGYDIFRTELNKNSASAPVNLGYPINTPADDIYFTMTSKYNRGYYSSNNLSGKGDMDIYRISFADERDPVSELKGFVKEGVSLKPVASKITMTSEDGMELLEQETNRIDGSYYFILGTERTYTLKLETEGYAPYEREFKIPKSDDFIRVYQEIHHIHLKDLNGKVIGQQTVISNNDGTKIEYEYKDVNDSLKTKFISSFVETKFYLTESELMKVFKEQPGLDIAFGESGTVEYLKDENLELYEGSSYSAQSSDAMKEKIALMDQDYWLQFITREFNAEEDSLNFSVQLGAYLNQQVQLKELHELGEVVTQLDANGNKIFYTGFYHTYEEANALKEKIKSKGFDDVFIISILNGEKISVAEGRGLYLLSH